MSTVNQEDFEVRDLGPGKGVGLFAARKFVAGEFVYRLDYWSSERTPMHLTNHSCDPNAGFDEGGRLVARRDIEPGDEISYDYTAHPVPASPWNFRCVCGAEKCRGWIDMS